MHLRTIRTSSREIGATVHLRHWCSGTGTSSGAITRLHAFHQVYALTHGGPGSATTTLGYAIYNQGFVTYRLGYASAIAWVLFAIIMALTALQLRLQARWVHYDI